LAEIWGIVKTSGELMETELGSLPMTLTLVWLRLPKFRTVSWSWI